MIFFSGQNDRDEDELLQLRPSHFQHEHIAFSFILVELSGTFSDYIY